MVLNDQYADGKVADFKDGDGIVTLQYERDPPPTNEVSGLAWNVGGRWECGCQNVPDVAVPAHRPVGGRRGGGSTSCLQAAGWGGKQVAGSARAAHQLGRSRCAGRGGVMEHAGLPSVGSPGGQPLTDDDRCNSRPVDHAPQHAQWGGGGGGGGVSIAVDSVPRVPQPKTNQIWREIRCPGSQNKNKQKLARRSCSTARTFCFPPRISDLKFR